MPPPADSAVPPALRTGPLDVPRTIPTADVLRALPYHSPMEGWHAHGNTLIPTDGCHACNELKRRQANAEAEDGQAQA